MGGRVTRDDWTSPWRCFRRSDISFSYFVFATCSKSHQILEEKRAKKMDLLNANSCSLAPPRTTMMDHSECGPYTLRQKPTNTDTPHPHPHPLLDTTGHSQCTFPKCTLFVFKRTFSTSIFFSCLFVFCEPARGSQPPTLDTCQRPLVSLAECLTEERQRQKNRNSVCLQGPLLCCVVLCNSEPGPQPADLLFTAGQQKKLNPGLHFNLGLEFPEIFYFIFIDCPSFSWKRECVCECVCE